MPRAAWVAVALLTAGVAPPTFAQPLEPLPPVGGPPLASTPVAPSRASRERPPPVLGAPVGVPDRAHAPAVVPSGFVDEPRPRPHRIAAFGAPSAAPSLGGAAPPPPAAPVSADLIDAAVSRTAHNQPADSVNEFLTKRSALKEREPAPRESSTGWPKLDVSRFGEGWGEGWGERFDNALGERNGGWFRSDHLFDGFISPVTNPFLFEDPRSLTEVRPIFIYQRIPTSQRDFLGGNVSFFGAQGRVAFTDRWSLVFHKLGGISLNPNDASPFGDNVGFAELWLGPKWTFYRGEETCSLAAAGLQFQLPVGSKDTFQDTGTLSLVPYVSYAQSFLRDFSWGSFNFMASTGYAFSTNRERSDYYFLSAHLDFDAGNFHRFYPLMELNWVLNTTNGQTLPIGSEGRDLINFGSQAKGSGLLTGAFGGRVKISENAQVGAAFEFPFAGRKDLFRHRFTLDFILRY